MHAQLLDLEKKLWSAADARGSELEIRRQLIQSGVVDVMVAIGSNFFSNVTLPCTLWFFDKSKANPPESPFHKGGRFLLPPLRKGGRGGFAFEVMRFLPLADEIN